MAHIQSEAQKNDEQIKNLNEPTILDAQRHLVKAFQITGKLYATANDLQSDNLVIAHTYINQAMKELLKANDR